MTQPANFEALSVESATIVTQPSTWQRVKRNASVRLGGIALLILLAVALAAPWLGTVDPSLFDPASRDLTPGKTGEITTLEGELLQHRFIMGSDSFGRDIYSRVIYGTQVSLIVGVATAVVALAFGILLGLPGLILGPFVGAVAGEMLSHGRMQQAARAGFATWIGLIFGTLAKLALVFTMLGIFLFAYLIG